MPRGVYPHTHIKPKTYPAQQVAEVKRLYWDEGMSIEEVAATLDLGSKVIRRLMENHDIPRRSKIKRNQAGANNSTWRGREASYNALHSRVERARGKPDCCEQCSADDPALRYEWAHLTGAYEDTNDYRRMCVPCHREFDAERRSIAGANTTPSRLNRGGGARVR